MNFSIHIDDTLAGDLEGLVKKSKTTRNALINQALRSYLEDRRRSKWPKAVLELAGAAKDLEPFERSRRELAPLSEDPLP